MTIAVQLLAMPVFQAPSTIQTTLAVRPGNLASQRLSSTTTKRSQGLFMCFCDNPVRVLVRLLEFNLRWNQQRADGELRFKQLAPRGNHLAASPRAVNFFNAICRLLRYEERLLAGISDPLVWIDPSVFAESGSVGTGLDSGS